MRNLNKKEAILSARLAHLYANSRLAIGIAFLLAILLVFVFHSIVASGLIYSWLALVSLISLVRLWMVAKYQRSPVADYQTLQARLRNFRLVITFAGLIWGSTGLLMFPTGDPGHQVFLIFIMAGISTAVVIAYVADIFCATAFGLAVLLPLIIRLFMEGDSLSVTMGATGFLYIGFLIASIIRSNKIILENLTLHYEASEREENVKISDEWHRSILNRAMDGFWLTDMQGKLLQVNETY